MGAIFNEYRDEGRYDSRYWFESKILLLCDLLEFAKLNLAATHELNARDELDMDMFDFMPSYEDKTYVEALERFQF